MRQIWLMVPAARMVEVPQALDAGLVAVRVTRPDGSIADFATFVRQTFTDSFGAIKGGAVVHQARANRMAADSPPIMFSRTRSFVRLFALMAIREGRVCEGTPVVQGLPDPGGQRLCRGRFWQVKDRPAAVRFSQDCADPMATAHDYGAILGAGGKAGAETAHTDHSRAATLQTDQGQAHGAVFVYQTPQAGVLLDPSGILFAKAGRMRDRRI